MKKKSFILYTKISIMLIVPLLILSMYSNCGRKAFVGSSVGATSDSANNADSVGVTRNSCPTGQAAIGLTSDKKLICANTTLTTDKMCGNDSSLYQVTSTGLLCTPNALWDQTGSLCPVGQYLISYTGAGAMQCTTLPFGGSNVTTLPDITCPDGEFLRGIVNNQPVCAKFSRNRHQSDLVCSPNQYLQDIIKNKKVCVDLPWTNIADQTCPDGFFAMGWSVKNKQLVCRRFDFNAPTANAQCPKGQVLVSYDNNKAVCVQPPEPDLSNVCGPDSVLVGVLGGVLKCQAVTNGTTLCPAGQFVVGLNNGAPICRTLRNRHLAGICPVGTYAVGVSNGVLICRDFPKRDNGTLCKANDERLCAVTGGIGTQKCDSSGTSYSDCMATGCFSGYILDSQAGICKATACQPGSSQSCREGSGAGTQFCSTNGVWNTCQISKCDDGFVPNGSNQCVTPVCEVGSISSCSSGVSYGYKVCIDGLHSGPCTITSCRDGYTLDPKTSQCLDKMPPRISFSNVPSNPTAGPKVTIGFAVIDNESGVKTISCLLDGSAYSPCQSPIILDGLADGSHHFTIMAIDEDGNQSTASLDWENDVCTMGTSVQCTIMNGQGAQSCQATGLYGDCVAVSCNSGYKIENGQCASLQCGPGYSVSGNECVDNTKPSLVVTPPMNPTIGQDVSIQFSVSDQGSGLSSVTCQLDQQVASACSSPLNLHLPYGSHTLIIRAVDKSGNSTARSITWINQACAPGTSVSCNVMNGQGQEMCLADGSGYGSCMATSCDLGYSASGGQCVALETVPVYRFYHQTTQEHFYTLTTAEGTRAGYKYEGIGFYVYSSNAPGTKAIYRCSWNTGNGTVTTQVYSGGTLNDIGGGGTGIIMDVGSRPMHFISTDIKCEGYQNEGLYGYVATTQWPKTKPLSRYYTDILKDHLYTTNPSVEFIDRHSYKLEGIVGYVPPGVPATVTTSCSGQLARACETPTGAGFQQCVADGTWGSCQLTSCNMGLTLYQGQCLPPGKWSWIGFNIWLPMCSTFSPDIAGISCSPIESQCRNAIGLAYVCR